MRTRMVPSGDWRRVLDALSRSCDRALVSLEIVGGEIGAEEEVRDQPLRGITSDTSGITVEIDRPGGLRLSHIIANPGKVRIVETDEGAVIAIEIEDNKGIRSLVRFRSQKQLELSEPPAG